MVAADGFLDNAGLQVRSSASRRAFAMSTFLSGTRRPPEASASWSRLDKLPPRPLTQYASNSRMENPLTEPSSAG